MGARNPQTLGFSDFAQGVETVNDMMVRRWRVRAYCPTCQKAFKVDLRVIATVKGPDCSLWDRRSSCKLFGCGGKVQFEAIPHRSQRIWMELSSRNRMGVFVQPNRRVMIDPERLRDDHPCGWL